MRRLSTTGWVRLCCVSGLAGSALFLAGDMLFYGVWSSGADFHPLKEMATRSISCLVLGGAVGPVAALFSAVGMGTFLLILKPAGPRTAYLATSLLSVMMLVGGSYHAVYAAFGFAARLDHPDRERLIAQITALRDAISYPMYASGILGTILVYWLAFRRTGKFPRWLLALTPTTLSMASSALPGYFLMIPFPLGGIIRGGWINGSFALFFFVATLALWRWSPQPA